MANQDLKQFLYDNPAENYFPEALKSGLYTPEEMRQHYSYLRKIANKRLQNFVGTEFEQHQSYIKNAGKFIPLSQINNERELMFRLYEVQKFVRSKSGSVSGIRDIRRRTIETAHERGMEWLNKNNIQRFGEYMEELRIRYQGRQFDSERAQELFGQAERLGMDTRKLAEDFEYWTRERIKELSVMPKFRNPRMRTSQHYKNALENRDKKRR